MTLTAPRRTLLLALIAAPLLMARPASALTWDDMSVDFPGMDLSSIAVDASGRPHIAYRDYLHGYLMYGRKNDNFSWQVWTVDATTGFAGWGVSMALDAAGNPHISYIRREHAVDVGDLVYAKGTCTPNGQSASCSFSKTVVDTNVNSINASGGTSLAIDGAGIPHIAYFDHTHQQLKWARKLPDIGWDKTNVVHSAGGGVSMVPDADGFPHMAFADSESGTLKYVRIVCHFILCGWAFETIDQGMTPALKRAASGKVHVAYRRSSNIRYAARTCTGETCTWSTPQVVGYSGIGMFPGLALDTAGAPVISFVRPEHFWYELIHATRWKFGWSLEVVDSDASITANSSIAIDSGNRRHISYPGDSDQSLRYMKGTGSIISPPWVVNATEVTEAIAAP
jgi:hypothetical protein